MRVSKSSTPSESLLAPGDISAVAIVVDIVASLGGGTASTAFCGGLMMGGVPGGGRGALAAARSELVRSGVSEGAMVELGLPWATRSATEMCGGQRQSLMS